MQGAIEGQRGSAVSQQQRDDHRTQATEKKRAATYERADGRQELRLHRLPLREPAADQDRVVRDLVRDLVREARERRRRADERRGVERRGHAGRTDVRTRADLGGW